MKRKINYTITALSIIIYLVMAFIIKLEGNFKELSSVYILAVPCFIIYINSLIDKENKKNNIYLYLIIYITLLITFVYQSARINHFTISGLSKYEINFIPFKSIISLLQSEEGISFGLYNIFGNLLMLTPFSVLLPLLNNKFKRTNKFLLTIILITLFIEITQLIFNVGSFDIDDIILNIGGAYLLYYCIRKYGLEKLVNKIFINNNVNKKYRSLYTRIYYILLIIYGFIILFQGYFIIYKLNEKDDIMTPDFHNLVCINNKKVYLGDYKNYHIYSKCEYGNNGIILNFSKENYQEMLISTFVSSSYFNEKYIKELDLIKEPIITNVKVYENKSNKKELILSYDSKSNFTSKENIYFYNINDILITQDGIEYSYKEYIQADPEERKIVTKVREEDIVVYTDNKTLGYSNDYFNILVCRKEKYEGERNTYFIPKDFKIDKNSCQYLDSLE